jgi:hypothetical protein
MLPSCCWVKLLNGFHVGFYKTKLHPLKLISILANIINSNPKFVTFITTSTILLNLFMELILSLTHCIYYYFYYLFISFHIESPLLIGVFSSSSFSSSLQSYVYARFYTDLSANWVVDAHTHHRTDSLHHTTSWFAEAQTRQWTESLDLITSSGNYFAEAQTRQRTDSMHHTTSSGNWSAKHRLVNKLIRWCT